MRIDSLIIWLGIIVTILADIAKKQWFGYTAGILTFIIIISFIDWNNVKDKLSFGLYKSIERGEKK